MVEGGVWRDGSVNESWLLFQRTSTHVKAHHHQSIPILPPFFWALKATGMNMVTYIHADKTLMCMFYTKEFKVHNHI